MIYDTAIETMQHAKPRKLQSEKFLKLVQYMYHNQPFYKKLWDEHGIDINVIKMTSVKLEGREFRRKIMKKRTSAILGKIISFLK